MVRRSSQSRCSGILDLLIGVAQPLIHGRGQPLVADLGEPMIAPVALCLDRAAAVQGLELESVS